MNAGIDLNSAIAQAASNSALLDQAAAEQTKTGESKLASILSGASLTITSAVGGGDLQSLIDKLKNEQERTKLSLLFSSLRAVGDSLSDAQKAALEEGIKLSEELDTLETSLSAAQKTLANSQKELVALQTKISALETQIEIAQKEGKDHLESEAELKRLREEKTAKEQVIADTQGKINEISNKVSNVKARLSVAISGVGENALKTIASELANIITPEEPETNAEKEKREAKEAEFDPFRAIRDSLDKFRQELFDAIETNTEHMV